VTWLLAFSPVIAVICYVMYDGVCRHRGKNRICDEVDIVIPDVTCLDVVDGSDSCSEPSISFDFIPLDSNVSRSLSASSHVSDGEQLDDRCSSVDLDLMLQMLESCNNEALDNADWSASSIEGDCSLSSSGTNSSDSQL
jgi:hypothetical protein